VAFERPTKLNPKQRWLIAERYAVGQRAAAIMLLAGSAQQMVCSPLQD